MSDPPHTPEEVHTDAILQELRSQLRAGASLPPEPATPPPTANPAQLQQPVEQLLEHVRDLQTRWTIHPVPVVSRAPLLGGLMTRGLRLLNSFLNHGYLGPILQQQIDFNATVVRTGQHLYQMLRILNDEVRYLREETHQYDRSSVDFSRRITLLEQAIRNTEESIVALQTAVSADRVAQLEARLTRLEGAAHAPASPSAMPAVKPGKHETPPGLPIDYFAFELRFRGPVEQVRERQRPYLQHFRPGRPVVDLGCGRGEFLELLQEAGIAATGVDSDAGMVAYCRERGLPVEQGDLFAFLEAQPDASLGGVFSAQVVEHLPPPTLVELMGLAFRKLGPGGVLLAETINPRSLIALSDNYTRDLTHLQPVHPDTLAFLAEAAGFAQVEVQYTSPVPELGQLQPVPPAGVALEGWQQTLNDNVRKANHLLFDYQDYALIARKGE